MLELLELALYNTSNRIKGERMKILETLSEIVGTVFVNFSSHVCVL